MKRLVTISAILLTSMVSSAALSAQEQERHDTLTVFQYMDILIFWV